MDARKLPKQVADLYRVFRVKIMSVCDSGDEIVHVVARGDSLWCVTTKRKVRRVLLTVFGEVAIVQSSVAILRARRARLSTAEKRGSPSQLRRRPHAGKGQRGRGQCDSGSRLSRFLAGKKRLLEVLTNPSQEKKAR
jgi:hypothetical protein